MLLSLQGEARFTNYSFVCVCVSSECVCREYVLGIINLQSSLAGCGSHATIDLLFWEACLVLLLSGFFAKQAYLVREGNGNPLQYSCLENPMDRGAWRAIVYAVTRVGHD